MDHAGHSHGHESAHPPATSIAELRHPPHGSYEGHVVPGVMFIVWGSYWILSIIHIHVRSRVAAPHAYLPLHSSKAQTSSSSSSSSNTCSSPGTARGEPFRSRAWYPWPYWPGLPLEPACKVVLPLLGVLIELYIGWGGWRPLYKADGHFAEFHANNWQHAVMYGVMAVSGAVDLIGYYTPLPAGTEQGFLSLAFLVETLLMGMHAKPNALDQLVHLLLTWVMISCIVVTAAEIAAPHSLLLALLRGMAVLFQGTWFWHVGAILFKNSMAWDMDDMASVMFVPVVFSLHMILICLGTFSLYLFMRCLYARLGITSSATHHQHYPHEHKQLASHQPAGASDSDLGVLLDTQLEMAEYAAAAAGGSGGSSDIHRVRDASCKGVNGHVI